MAWIMYLGTALGALGQYEQGQDASRNARANATIQEFEAVQYEQRAKQEVASSQRAALEEERRSRIVQSAVVARAQGGAGDPTVVDILSDLADEGAYRSAVALYEGQERARQARMGATAARYEASGYRRAGSDYATAGRLAAAGTLASGYARGGGGSGGGLYGKYGDMPTLRYTEYPDYSMPRGRLANMGSYQ